MPQSVNDSVPRPARADRNANTQIVLSVLRAHGPVSQAEIARLTALSRATVNNIVQGLRDQGTIEYHWKNGREASVALAATRGAIVALRVSERMVAGSLFDFATQARSNLSLHEIPEFADQRSSPAQAVEIARRLIALADERGTPAVGVALAIEGPIETATGAIAPLAWQRLPQWKGVNIAQAMGRKLRLPLTIDNDANFAALAEWTWGEGRGCSDFIDITCSEGVGGGIVLGGQIYRGGNGLAGEIGHMVIEADGDLCFCGSRGCLSSFVTERAIVAALRNAEHPKQNLAEVIAGARAGDAACQRVLFEAGVHLGKAIATLVRVLSPGAIAIGGTLGIAGDIVLDGLRSSPEIINLRAIGQSPRISIAVVGKDAVELGGVAAILAQLDLGAGALQPWMRRDPAPVETATA